VFEDKLIMIIPNFVSVVEPASFNMLSRVWHYTDRRYCWRYHSYCSHCYDRCKNQSSYSSLKVLH